MFKNTNCKGIFWVRCSWIVSKSLFFPFWPEINLHPYPSLTQVGTTCVTELARNPATGGTTPNVNPIRINKIRFDFTFGKLYIKITKVYVWLRFYTLLGAILLSWGKKEKSQTRVYGIF
jgi:hypothetical protein